MVTSPITRKGITDTIETKAEAMDVVRMAATGKVANARTVPLTIPVLTEIMERIVHSAVMEIILSSAVMETDRDITAIRIVPRVLPMRRAITIMKEVSSVRIVRVTIITREVNSARSVRVTTTVSSRAAVIIARKVEDSARVPQDTIRMRSIA